MGLASNVCLAHRTKALLHQCDLSCCSHLLLPNLLPNLPNAKGVCSSIYDEYGIQRSDTVEWRSCTRHVEEGIGEGSLTCLFSGIEPVKVEIPMFSELLTCLFIGIKPVKVEISLVSELLHVLFQGARAPRR